MGTQSREAAYRKLAKGGGQRENNLEEEKKRFSWRQRVVEKKSFKGRVEIKRKEKTDRKERFLVDSSQGGGEKFIMLAAIARKNNSREGNWRLTKNSLNRERPENGVVILNHCS